LCSVVYRVGTNSVYVCEGSIEHGRRAAAEAGVADRVSFEVAPAKSYPGDGYDLVAMFDCLHDMGDPVGASAHVLETLTPDGTWMIVEPNAGDRLEDNLNPVGRVFYGASTLVCTPASRDQEVGLALGAQAGEARLREVVTAGGLLGRVLEVGDTFVTLEIAEGVRVKVQRFQVVSLMPKGTLKSA